MSREAAAGAQGNVFSRALEAVLAAIGSVAAAGGLPATVDLSRVLVEPPRDPTHGDMAANAAMVLAKEAGREPRELAEDLAAALRANPLFQAVAVAGPGFLNLTLAPQAWIGELRSVLRAGTDYGRADLGKGATVNVEYVSANPTGPMHIGHCRGAVFGDALANLLAFTGHAVAREYYINDAGAQVDVLARSAFLRYREALGENVGTIPEGLYPGDYLVPVGQALAAEFGPELKGLPEAEWLPIVRERAIAAMMEAIRADLAALNVRHDVFFSERSLGDTDAVHSAIEALDARGLVYTGRLPPPKGQPAPDWEDREQVLFRSTAFGDDIDRPLLKSDGSYTYFAADIAYHKSKLDRGFHRLIDVWGADHGGYVKRMQAAVKAFADGAADLDVKIVQLVRLLRAGEPVKMSKRAGEFVTLREVVDEVGRDAVRFMMLFRKNDAVLDFDLSKVIEQSRDNPIFYVQYAHARGQSVFRNARDVVPELPEADGERRKLLLNSSLELLGEPTEMELLKRIGEYPRVVEAAALAHEPHRVAFFLYELAGAFHVHWTRGRDAPHLRFIILDDRKMTLARLALVQGVVTVLASGLSLLGVDAPEEMR